MRFVLLVAIVAACNSEAPQATPTTLSAVVYGHGQFVALRNQPVGFTIETSPDALTWTEVARRSEHGAGLGGIAVSDTGFLAIASDITLADGFQSMALFSTDGTTWTRVADPPRDASSVGALGDHFIAAAEQTGIVTSRDGMSWSAPVPNTGGEVWLAPRVAVVGQRAFVYGEGALLAETSDGETWAAANTQLTNIVSVGALAGTAVGFGEFDCCFHEQPDKIIYVGLRRAETTWDSSPRASPGPIAFLDVGGRAVAADYKHLLLSDDNGATWRPVADLLYPLRASFASDGRGTILFAGGQDALVSQDNGETWMRITNDE